MGFTRAWFRLKVGLTRASFRFGGAHSGLIQTEGGLTQAWFRQKVGRLGCSSVRTLSLHAVRTLRDSVATRLARGLPPYVDPCCSRRDNIHGNVHTRTIILLFFCGAFHCGLLKLGLIACHRCKSYYRHAVYVS